MYSVAYGTRIDVDCGVFRGIPIYHYLYDNGGGGYSVSDHHALLKVPAQILMKMYTLDLFDYNR